MSQPAGNLVEGSLVWQRLSEHVDAFITAWEQGEPPTLGEFLPEGPPALRRMTLAEAVKVDLEYRWQDRRWPKLIEEYVSEFPELEADDGVPCDIIYEEYHIRKQRGDAVSVDQYCNRFPTRADQLRRLLKLEGPEQTTVLLAADRAPEFEPGQRIDDFDLISPLGKGAFASVFLARQCSMQRTVALKISRDRGFEPQTLAQLDHPHIVRVFDQRQWAARKLRLLYMQFVPGGTLQGVVEQARGVPSAARDGSTLLAAIDRALERQGEQPPTDSMTRYRLRRATWPQVVCWLGARLASALSYAHERGVLHRDVKPANVLVGADGHPKLADFNISFSKLDGATPAAYFGGSLAYMSPEQLEACDPSHPRQADELDGRSDIYSLGVLLWELLTLERPFNDNALGGGWSQALVKMSGVRRGGVAPEVRKAVPAGCPQALVDILLKCLAPNPEDRYQSAGELAAELDLCLQPRAHGLLRLRSFFKRHPVASTIIAGTIPNVIMSILNTAFNYFEIVESLQKKDPHVAEVFPQVIVGMNLIAYTLGLGYVCYKGGRMFLTVGRLARGKRVEPPPSADVVRQCLALGYVTAVTTAVLWGVSGFVFPAWIEWASGTANRLLFPEYVDFIVSNLLCGMIAATQSYYVVTFFAVRYCCPWLLQARPPDARGVTDLADQANRDRIFLGLTFSVPFVALFSVLALSGLQLIPDLEDRIVLGALGGLGLAGCALAYVLELAIRSDLEALATAMNSGGDPLLGSGPPFLTDSRR